MTASPSSLEQVSSYQSTVTPLSRTEVSMEAFDASTAAETIGQRPFLVHTALISAQMCFGLGGIISALGLPACNPFAFALYREITAGILLGVAAATCSGARTTRQAKQHSGSINWPRFTLLGLTLFGNQACVIAGIKLAGPVAAAVWQPSQPIITAGLSMILGWEVIIYKRVIGVLTSFLGCSVMVFLSSNGNGSSDTTPEDSDIETSPDRTIRVLVGHALFFANCLCTSLYVLLSKAPLRQHSALKVTAWSYNIAAVFMLITSYVSSLSQPAIDFLCPDCVSTWVIPTGAVWALVYAILFNSVVAYFLIQWANQHATGTLVMGYSTLQPVTVTVLTAILLGSGTFERCSVNTKEVTTNDPQDGGSNTSIQNINDAAKAYRCLDAPGWGTILGMVGVFSGLWLVITTEPDQFATQGEATREDDYLQRYRKVPTTKIPENWKKNNL